MRLFLVFPIVRTHDCRRLFPNECIDKETDAYEDERNAQTLPHVEDHIVLERNLRLLDEFYQESHSEADDEEYADKCASIQFVEFVSVHPYQDYSQYEIAERLINLCRMFRLGFVPQIEYESPRK